MAPPEVRRQQMLRIAERAAAEPAIDDRTADEILGYDEDGLPT
jgi:hypothetical protein